MAAWTKAYAAHSNMRSVKMVQNGIRQEGIVALLRDGLSNCAKLQVLDLQDNTFTERGAKALADAVGKWEGIKELGVSDSLLKPRGGVTFLESLKKGANKQLEVLRLQYNEIDAEGLRVLVDAAKSDALPSLRRVELNGNKFSDEDNNVEILREVLAKRKESAGEDADDEDEDAWGVDELDDMEEDSEDDEDGKAEDEDDAEEVSILKDADTAADEPVTQESDKEVDKLADLMDKTELK